MSPITQTSLITPPLSSPPTDEKSFTQVHQVIALFKEIRAGKHFNRDPWTEFYLSEGEYDEIKHQLEQDEDLWGYVQDKIRYDYNGESNRLVFRMPTEVHELFIDSVEDAIRSQLKAIREGIDKAARFAQKVRPFRSTIIYLPPGKSRYEPDASFRHLDTRYPGVIIEVGYSQKKKSLRQLAENYLLNSNANICVVIGLDIEYGKKGSHTAALSTWRTRLVHTANGDELQVDYNATDVIFRNDQGIATDSPGIRLNLSDFAPKRLVREAMGDLDQELIIPTQQLCEFLNEAEEAARREREESLFTETLPAGIKKRKRSETPPEEITSADEAKYIKQDILNKRRE